MFVKTGLDDKLIKRENISRVISDLKKQGKTIVTTNGCFDILHVGHVRYLKKTSECADILVVALNSDKSVKSIKGESRPINKELERAEVLAALEFVDYIVLFDEDSPINLLLDMKPDVYTKGADYTLETLPEAKPLLAANIDIRFIDLVEGKSTTKILEKMKS